MGWGAVWCVMDRCKCIARRITHSTNPPRHHTNSHTRHNWSGFFLFFHANSWSTTSRPVRCVRWGGYCHCYFSPVWANPQPHPTRHRPAPYCRTNFGALNVRDQIKTPRTIVPGWVFFPPFFIPPAAVGTENDHFRLFIKAVLFRTSLNTGHR